MTNCDWFFSIECSAPESEVRSHSNSCEGPPPEPQPQPLLWCCSCACKHSKQYSRHTSRDVQAFWNVSFISHSLTGSPNLFGSLSFANSLSLFYKGRYTNNPHMFSSFLTYSCLLEDEHISLCLFLSISFTHIHARHTQ